MSGPILRHLQAGLAWIGVVVLMGIICLPGVWVLVSAFRPNQEILTRPPIWIPQDLSWHNFAVIFSQDETRMAIPVFAYFWNSLVVALTSTTVVLAIGMAGGYAFARYQFRFKHGWFLGLMLLRAVPGVALSLPLFYLWSRIGLIDTQMGLILVYVALNAPFTVWLLDGFFRQVPPSLSEAAQMDGCTRWQAYWRIEFPLSRPGIAAAGIFAFLTSWNEYALASHLTRTADSRTLPLGLMELNDYFSIDWATMSALAAVIIAPTVILTYLVQKHMIAGLTLGAVKG